MGKEIIMSNDVNGIIENAIGQVRLILTQAVQNANEETRAELIQQFNHAVGGTTITTVKASRAVKVKAPKVSKEDKPKRKVSAETRAKLALNLKKARDAKAQKAGGPAKKKIKAKTKK